MQFTGLKYMKRRKTVLFMKLEEQGKEFQNESR